MKKNISHIKKIVRSILRLKPCVCGNDLLGPVYYKGPVRIIDVKCSRCGRKHFNPRYDVMFRDK